MSHLSVDKTVASCDRKIPGLIEVLTDKSISQSLTPGIANQILGKGCLAPLTTCLDTPPGYKGFIQLQH